MRPGQDIRFSDPARIGREVIEFLEITAAEIAAGLGVPFEQLTTDLRRVNFSSIRAGLVEFRRRTEAIQFNVLVHQFCDPVWRRWVTTEILAGRLAAPGFERDPEPYLSANWLPPKTHWVDPLKDAEGEVVAIEAGLMSRRQAVAARRLRPRGSRQGNRRGPRQREIARPRFLDPAAAAGARAGLST